MGSFFMRAFSVIAVLVSIGSGCATYRADFEVRLVEVERSVSGGTTRFTEGIGRLGDGSRTVYLFQDELVSAFWLPDGERLEFKLVNKTDGTVRILWDEAAFVDVNGESHRVVHAGVDPEDKHLAQPPSPVVKGGKISDRIIPADKVRYVGNVKKEWRELPLFTQPHASKGILKAEARQYVGKRVKVLLPLKIGGEEAEYLFTFEIKSFRIE